MIIPLQYAWLKNEVAPQILMQARSFLGIHEGPGAVDNQTIINWANEVGRKVGIAYDHDEIPWCGLFMGLCCKRAGLEIPDLCIRAKSWATWGVPVADAALGDVLVFTRTGGGHVGLYVAEDAECYHVLGGNQSDAVSIMRLQKSRVSAIRRTRWQKAQPPGVRRIHVSAAGTVSHNEA